MGSSHAFGPINVRNDEEAGLLKALVEEKCDAAKLRQRSLL